MSRAPIVLINAGAYIPQELSAEFGALPPAFLPVGMRRLYELQVKSLAPLCGEVVLTLPRSMTLPLWDRARLDALGVRVLRSPDGLSLGAALLQNLANLGFDDRPLRMLHGDTLVTGINVAADDVVSVAPGADGYAWAHVHQSEGRIDDIAPPRLADGGAAGLRLTGYYAFSDVGRFARALALAAGDFVGALNHYAADVGLRVLHAEGWLDFGHVQTFFQSRRIVTTARAFNALEISETTVRKRSAQRAKLEAEASWLGGLPGPLRPYAVRLFGEGEDAAGYFYDTEYRSMPTLAELLVFGALTLGSWQRVFKSCQTFLDLAVRAAPADGPAPSLDALAVDKTRARLQAYSRTADLDLEAPNTLNGIAAPSLSACLERIAGIVATDPPRPSVMHGDFCFSNILYDFRTDRIQLIDPRGLTADGAPSLYGDARYDVAKFMHSLAGRYDLIVAGRYSGGRVGPNEFSLSFPEDELRLDLVAAASALTMGGVRLGSPAVLAVTASLFLSMAPLHADRPDRQAAFIANGLRLMQDLEGAVAAPLA